MTAASRFSDPSILKINIEEQFGATYEFFRYDCTQNITTMALGLVMHLKSVADSPASFSYTFQKNLIPEFLFQNFTVTIKFLDENGNDIAHQESGDFIERLVGAR